MNISEHWHKWQKISLSKPNQKCSPTHQICHWASSNLSLSIPDTLIKHNLVHLTPTKNNKNSSWQVKPTQPSTVLHGNQARRPKLRSETPISYSISYKVVLNQCQLRWIRGSIKFERELNRNRMIQLSYWIMHSEHRMKAIGLKLNSFIISESKLSQ